MKKIYIPYGITMEKEYMLGFGKKEAKHFFIGLLITVVTAVLSYLISQQIPAPIIILLVGATGSYVVSKKEPYSLSVVETIKNILRFYRMCQKFKYVNEIVPRSMLCIDEGEEQ